MVQGRSYDFHSLRTIHRSLGGSMSIQLNPMRSEVRDRNLAMRTAAAETFSRVLHVLLYFFLLDIHCSMRVYMKNLEQLMLDYNDNGRNMEYISVKREAFVAVETSKENCGVMCEMKVTNILLSTKSLSIRSILQLHEALRHAFCTIAFPPCNMARITWPCWLNCESCCFSPLQHGAAKLKH